MTTLGDLAARYDRASRRHEKARERLTRLRDEADAKLKRLHWPSWIDSVLAPIASAFEAAMPDRRAEILGPFGIPANTSIHLYRRSATKEHLFNAGNCISINFRPQCCAEGFKLHVVDHTRNTGRYRAGSMGEANDMNYESIEVPATADAAWFMAWLRKQNAQAFPQGRVTATATRRER